MAEEAKDKEIKEKTVEAKEEKPAAEPVKAEAPEAKTEAKEMKMEKAEERKEAEGEKKEEKPKEEKPKEEKPKEEKPKEEKPKEEAKEEKAEEKPAEKKEEKPAEETPRVKRIVTKRVDTLVDSDVYLKTGAHIGTKFKSGEMRRFIYKERKDGLKVLNVQTLDERIKTAATFLSQFDPEQIVVISRKLYGHTPAKAFAKAVGGQALTARFVPGTFTNPQAKSFMEPAVIIVTETDTDSQAVLEAASVRVPVVALASTNNALRNIDLVVPINNKGRKSLALVYWLLARELLKLQGKIKTDAEFTHKVEDFEFRLKEGENRPRPDRQFKRKRFPGKRFGGKRR